MPVSYELPPNVYSDWAGCEAESFQPTNRQKIVIAAVQAALDAGCYYSSEVLKAVSERLGVTEEQSLSGARHVEGGHVGMDCYYARKYIRAQRDLAMEYENARRLKAFAGMEVGTVMFNDFKRTTGVHVVDIDSQGRELTLCGRRGRLSLTMSCTVTNLAYAIDRAAQRNLRKHGFALFCIRAPRTADPAQPSVSLD